MKHASLFGLAAALTIAAIAVAMPRGSEHEDIVKQYVSALWTVPGNPDAAKAILATDFVRHGPTDYTSAAGLEDLMAYNDRVRAIFPDLRCRVDEFFELNDVLGAKWTCGGTHAETGNKVKASGTSLYDFAGGRLVMERTSWDFLDVARQIGAAPPLDAAQQNISLAKRLTTELYERGNMPAAYEFLAEDFVIHVPAGGTVRGIEAAQARAQMFRKAFPDIRFITHESIASGDTVATRWTLEHARRAAVLTMNFRAENVAIEVSRALHLLNDEDMGQLDAVAC